MRSCAKNDTGKLLLLIAPNNKRDNERDRTKQQMSATTNLLPSPAKINAQIGRAKKASGPCSSSSLFPARFSSVGRVGGRWSGGCSGRWCGGSRGRGSRGVCGRCRVAGLPVPPGSAANGWIGAGCRGSVRRSASGGGQTRADPQGALARRAPHVDGGFCGGWACEEVPTACLLGSSRGILADDVRAEACTAVTAPPPLRLRQRLRRWRGAGRVGGGRW